MELRTNKEEILSRLKKHIERHGYMPEHHPYLFLYYDVAKGYETVYFDFGEQGGMVGYRKRHLWRMVGEPIASKKKRAMLFLDVLAHVFFREHAKKVTLEDWGEELRKDVEGRLGRLKLRATKPFYTLFWPVCDLGDFNENLEGKKLKGMRYARNRFLNNRVVRVIDARDVDQTKAVELVHAWRKKRNGNDAVYPQEYVRMVENGFPGCDISRAIFVGEELRGLSAGWGIPNSKTYYLFLDIHDYSDPYLGEFVSLDHFLEARKRGYKLLDFGGSDKPLLNFKIKFHPIETYTTRNFSILRG